MSSALGAVRFKDGEIWFFEYYGTTGTCVRNLYPNKGELEDNWRNHPPVKVCSHAPEQVSIVADYGDGFWFEGEACRKCRCLKDYYCYMGRIRMDGHPEWSPFKESE